MKVNAKLETQELERVISALSKTIKQLEFYMVSAESRKEANNYYKEKVEYEKLYEYFYDLYIGGIYANKQTSNNDQL